MNFNKMSEDKFIHFVESHGLQKSGRCQERYERLINKRDKVSGNKEAYFDLLPTVLNGISGYIVCDWKNVLDTDRTPLKYKIGDGTYFVAVNDNREILIIDALNTFRYIRRGDFISKELWRNYFSVMINAGHRLAQIFKEERKSKIIRFKI